MNYMIEPSNPTPQPTAIIAGPWPRFTEFRLLPERERWVMYGTAKAIRGALEDQGIAMAESYDAFIKRITDEMGI